jgi:hypothetical protein
MELTDASPCCDDLCVQLDNLIADWARRPVGDQVFLISVRCSGNLVGCSEIVSPYRISLAMA